MISIKKFLKGLKIVPKTTLESDEKGELEVDSSTGKLNYHNGTTRSPVVTEAHTQTLLNKQISAADNTIANLGTGNFAGGVINTDTGLAGAADNQIPSALAVKTFIEDELAFQDQASEITLVPVGTIVATNVQDAVAELDGDIQGHINDTVDAHDASAISNIPSGNLSATDVQAALNELQGDIDTNTTGLSNHLSDTTDAHDASAISVVPVGGIAATDVQAALAELDSELDTLDGEVGSHITATIDVHGVGVGNSVVGTGTTQTLTNKTVTGADIRTPVRSDVKQDTKANLETYALTATNGQLVFATDTKEMFQVVDAALVPVGAGGGEGDVDSLLVQNFETAARTDFTQTGLTLTETNPIRGEISARLVHQPAVNQSFKQTIAVDRKFRGVPMTVALSARSTASSGNLIIQFRDETNALNLQESQQIIATSTIQTFQFGVTIPANCESFSYTITALPQSGSPESVIDDIVIRNYWMGTANLGQTEYQFEVPVVTEWQSYTPTFQGLGTPTSVDARYRIVGTNVEIDVSLTTGAPTNVEARIGLPLSLVSSISTSSNNIPVGTWLRNVGPSTTIKRDLLLSQNGTSYVTVSSGEYAIAANPFSPLNANTVFGTGERLTFQAIIPCAGLTATTTKKVISTDLVPAKALSGNASISVPNVTGWQGYTPTFQGFGTPTNIEFEWRQSGESVEIRGKFVSGIPTAVEARVGLPGGLTSAGTSLIPSIQLIGYGQRAISTTQQYGVLIEPSVAHMTFSAQGTTSGVTKRNATDLVNGGDSFSFFASVPCAGLTATKTETIGLAQSLLVQEADSAIELNTANGGGSTNTLVRRFTNPTLVRGTAITYSDSPTLGATFTINEAGVYSISYTDSFTTSSGFAITKNVSGNTAATNATAAQKLATSVTNSSNEENISWQGYLEVGDVITARRDAAIAEGVRPNSTHFSIVKQGSLKQLNPNPNSKITIPTSELRMEGASTRGSTATAIVRFDNIAKIRGDAFTVESDATLGTRIVMRKKGRLAVSASFVVTTGGNSIGITRNQSVLTAFPSAGTGSEVIQWSTANSGYAVPVGAEFDVAIGDVIRISSSTTISGDTRNSLNATFQEQDISVSVTNTLPQFSESDSSVRVDTANGYGSTGTRIRRFSNVRDNIGNDIEYVPSAVNGDSFVVKSAGTYNISYTDMFNNASPIAITRNSSLLSTNIESLVATEVLSIAFAENINWAATAPWSGTLNAGDIIRAQANGLPTGTNGSINAKFTISKVGKPNVTGVDVTPFVNIPRDERQSNQGFLASISAGGAANIPQTFSKGGGIFTYSAGVYTILKPCLISLTVTFTSNSAFATFAIIRNGNRLAEGISPSLVGATESASWTGEANVGDTFSFNSGTGSNQININSFVTATAASDSIITANESFSTDTANLVYAPSSLYTLATLSNAPVGTFITFTYAGSNNTRTQTTTAPTQTVADMNVNGIQVFTRAFTAASTAAQPASIAIQIGKGLKGFNTSGFRAVGKVGIAFTDHYVAGSVKLGLSQNQYDPRTGIMYLDAGFDRTGGSTGSFFSVDDTTLGSQTSAYFTVEASKSPALTGVPLLQPRIATISDVKANGTPGGTPSNGAYFARTLNTITDPTGIVTSLGSNQFVLPAGEYYIEAVSPFAFVAQGGVMAKIKLRNVSDGTDVIIGDNSYLGASVNGEASGGKAHLRGNIVISSPKTFELQYRTTSTWANIGLGVNASFGDNEVYSLVTVQKVK